HRKFFERWKDTLATHRFNSELPALEAERSVRMRALVIDDSVPEPDKDAGSNAVFQHILTLQRLGYKVTFIPGDNMARIDPYTAEQMRRLELGAMFFVDCVIVHSAAEAELLAKLAPGVQVQVIPWTVEPRPVTPAETERPAIAFVGGYRHEPNIDAAKWAAAELMPRLRKEVPGIELLLVGSHMPPEVAALAEKDVVPLGYVPSLDTVFERVRLTIAPLR